MRRRFAMLFIGMLVAAGVPFVGVASAHGGSPKAVTANITGMNIFKVNKEGGANYSFPNVIRIAAGGTITFQNRSDDFHTITLVNQADLPTDANQGNNCGVCNQVNPVYGTGPGGAPPTALQIQNGVPGAGLGPDPAVAGGTFMGLPAKEIQFGHPATATFKGDSSIIGFSPAATGFTARTIQAPSTPGTYYYMCTFHPWMQGKIIVG